MPDITVLIVDDNPVIKEWLVRSALRVSDIRAVGYVASADDAEEAVDRLSPAVVVMDLDMPGEEPLTVVNRLTRRDPPARVTIFSSHCSCDRVAKSFAAGALGYVC